MPLTALMHPDGRRLDSTKREDWDEVIALVKPPLYCYECSHGMHCVKATEERIRFFRHSRGRPDTCSRISSRETPEHLLAKKLIAEAIRALPGWTAELERGAQGWVADVLATGPDGRRIAFEPQLAAVTTAWATERTGRRTAAGLETVWLDGNGQFRGTGLPWARLDAAHMRVTTWALPPIGLVPERVLRSVEQFAQEVCLGGLAWTGECFAPPGDVAEANRRREAARVEREQRQAEEAKARAERTRQAVAGIEELRIREDRDDLDPEGALRLAEAEWERELREAEQRQQRQDELEERWAREEAAAEEARKRHAERMKARREAAICPNCRERDHTPGYELCVPCFYRPEYWHWSNRAIWAEHFNIKSSAW